MRLTRRMRLAGIVLASISVIALSACGGDENRADKFVLAYNAEGGHDAWVDAVTNQVQNELGIKAEGKSYASFDELRTDITERSIKTAFRTGWQPDYPSIFNYLQPLYQTNAGANDGDYSNNGFDELLQRISAADNKKEQYKLQADAQEVLLDDLPAIPLWYQNIAAAAAKKVDNVEFNWQNRPEFSDITKKGGPITINGTEPQNPLVPTATNEVGGGDVIDQLFAGLVAYETDGTSTMEIAKSITSKDNKVWTVKLKAGKKFSDGTDVSAKSFVDAWNYGALSTNAQLNSYFFEPIEGFEDVQEKDPKVETLSGLKVKDDHTFTITLQQPEADFPDRLGYAAFYPLPESAFKDMKAFGNNPVGNGPYKMANDKAWEHDVQISLVPNDSYDGVRPAKNDGLVFKHYSNLDSAYTDVQAGNLDVLTDVPDSALANYEDDAKIQAFSKPGSVFQSFTFPKASERFGQDEEGKLRRQAISMAIDREATCDKIFNGTRTPAVDFSSPAMPGFNDELDGKEVLEYNPEKAKELWKKANDIKPWTE